MAEHVRKPGEAQDRSADQNDHKSRNRVGDERREKDAANHQFTKGMSHEPFSVGALAACGGAASITAPARRRAALASIARYSSPEAASRKLRAMAWMRCASRSTKAVRASAARLAKGLSVGPSASWVSLALERRIAAAWSKYESASSIEMRCCRSAPAAATICPTRTASRNIASSGAYRRSLRDSTRPSSWRADAINQRRRRSCETGGTRNCAASNRPIPTQTNKEENRKACGS